MSLINETLDAGVTLTRHMHKKPYVTLILSGSYIEAGDHGRFEVKPGDILMHGHFAAHANWISPYRDVKTLNIELNDIPNLQAVCTSDSFDSVIKYAKYDIPLALNELFSSIVPKAQPLSDWPEVLAKAIRNDPIKDIGYWCKFLDLTPGTVSRGFKRAFGVTVTQYRATVRARGALLKLRKENVSLSELAYAWGFSDQPHFTRAIRALTGQTPSYWQKVKNIQDKNSRP
ncbi:AraC family transcriptional regulator [Alteromonadaceae bacterium M269]|nr:AraC family transcriptional regulator [Alteromonadaceae bacterium M269]